MGDLSYWSANSLFKQTSHSRKKRVVVRGSQSESNYISWPWAHLFFKDMELLLRSACILAFVPLSIQLCPLWPGIEARPFKKLDLALILGKLSALLLQDRVWQHRWEDGSLLPYWNWSEPHNSGCQLWALCRLLLTFPLPFHIFKVHIKEKKSSRSHEISASAMQSGILPILVPNKPGLTAPAISISLMNLSVASFLTSFHFLQWNRLKKKKRPAIFCEHQEFGSICNSRRWL